MLQATGFVHIQHCNLKISLFHFKNISYLSCSAGEWAKHHFLKTSKIALKVLQFNILKTNHTILVKQVPKHSLTLQLPNGMKKIFDPIKHLQSKSYLYYWYSTRETVSHTQCLGRRVGSSLATCCVHNISRSAIGQCQTYVIPLDGRVGWLPWHRSFWQLDFLTHSSLTKEPPC